MTICIDEVTAGWVQMRLKKSAGRLRRLARVRLAEDETPIDVFGLLPPLAESPSVTDEMIAQHDSALDAIEEGHWETARSILAQLPESDQATRFLLGKMAETSGVPPFGWDGAFSVS